MECRLESVKNRNSVRVRDSLSLLYVLFVFFPALSAWGLHPEATVLPQFSFLFETHAPLNSADQRDLPGMCSQYLLLHAEEAAYDLAFLYSAEGGATTLQYRSVRRKIFNEVARRSVFEHCGAEPDRITVFVVSELLKHLNGNEQRNNADRRDKSFIDKAMNNLSNLKYFSAEQLTAILQVMAKESKIYEARGSLVEKSIRVEQLAVLNAEPSLRFFTYYLADGRPCTVTGFPTRILEILDGIRRRALNPKEVALVPRTCCGLWCATCATPSLMNPLPKNPSNR